MDKLYLPGFTVLPDRVDVGDDETQVDIFALETKLGSVVDIIRNKDTATPMSISLRGSAGAGKTTALRWLKKQLEAWNELEEDDREDHPKVIPVWFSVGACHADDNVVCKIVTAIILACLNHIPEGEYRREFVSLIEEKNIISLSPEFRISFVDKVREWGLLDMLQSKPDSVVISNRQGNAFLEPCFSFIETWFELLREIEGTFRIVVLIDNMDDCHPNLLTGVLDAIRFKLNSPNVLYIATFDEPIVQTLVKQHLTENGFGDAQAAQYLERIFDVDCHIAPGSQQIERFYKHQITMLNEQTGDALDTLLNPEYTDYIEAAIIALSKNNPSKIKQLLNSAVMQAYAAVRDYDLTDDDSAALQLPFGQCIQVYLLQYLLSSHPAGGSAIYRDDVLAWFSALSEISSKPGADYSQIEENKLGMDSDAQFERRALRNTRTTEQTIDARYAPPEGLDFTVIQEWVWDLLKIPFNPDAVTFELESLMGEMERVAIAKSGLMERASTTLKEIIATSLNTATEDLTDDDLDRIKQLDLSEKPLKEDDFDVLGGCSKLEKLDLHNTVVSSLTWATGLSKLKVLNLTFTQVADIKPLKKLKNLESLDLSYTGVKDLKPIASVNSKLNSLILYATPIDNIEPLQGMKNLKRLNLAQTGIKDADVSVLETLPELTTLFLKDTAVTPERIAKLNMATDFNLKIDT